MVSIFLVVYFCIFTKKISSHFLDVYLPLDTEGGGEASTSNESQSRHKKGYMTNIYLTDSDEEAFVDFVKNHEELYDKTNEQFKDKARTACGKDLQAATSSQ